jgi:hypothetical protein
VRRVFPIDLPNLMSGETKPSDMDVVLISHKGISVIALSGYARQLPVAPVSEHVFFRE